MDFSFLNNIFPNQDDPNAFQKNMNIGLLGLSLMKAAQPTSTPQSFGSGLLGSGFNLPQSSISGANQATAQQAPVDQLSAATNPIINSSTSYSVTPSLSPNKADMLQNLKQQASLAYPDNPLMQQVAITQAIEESNLMGSHPSQLAMKDNNLFGIKSSGTAGVDYLPTNEFVNGQMQRQQAGFGRNKSVADSFMQHRNLLENNSRYKNVVNSQTPTEAFQALQSAGYATDPHYAKNLQAAYSAYVAPLY